MSENRCHCFMPLCSVCNPTSIPKPAPPAIQDAQGSEELMTAEDLTLVARALERDRDEWRTRAEAAEKEVERLRVKMEAAARLHADDLDVVVMRAEAAESSIEQHPVVVALRKELWEEKTNTREYDHYTTCADPKCDVYVCADRRALRKERDEAVRDRDYAEAGAEVHQRNFDRAERRYGSASRALGDARAEVTRLTEALETISLATMSECCTPCNAIPRIALAEVKKKI